uniref:Cytochrome P450 CYP1 n=1 Tax=Dermanyssus gallinae TaxID=34641 RepID=A0A6M3HA10_9ACAR|nr:cytochrome P450 CYP1 [Dermanyssus gallinae]
MGPIVLLLLAALLTAVLAIRRRAHFGLFRRLGLPGPAPSLLTGNLIQFTTMGFTKAFDDWSRRYGNTFGYFYGVQPVIVTTDKELLHKVIFKDAHNFYNRAFQFNLDTPHSTAGKQLHILREPAEIKAIRTQFTSTFTANKLKKAIDISEESVRTFLSVIKSSGAGGREFEITEPLKRLAMDSMGRTSFGLALPVQTVKETPIVIQQCETLAHQSLASTKEYIATCLPKSLTQPVLRVLYAARLMANTMDPLVKSVGAIIDARNESASKRSDIIDNLLHKDILGRPMTRPEAIANATVAYYAGFETTAITLALTTFRLGRHPEWQEKLRAEIKELWDDTELYDSLCRLKTLDMIICETLRLDPPAPAFVTREAAEDYQYGSLLIPKGTAVQAPVTLLQRDPTIYSNPDEFNPEHFRERVSGVHYMPFGEGPRNCVGMRFALVQVKLAIVRLVQNYRIQLGADCTDLRDLPLKDTGILRRPPTFHVKLDPIESM